MFYLTWNLICYLNILDFLTEQMSLVILDFFPVGIDLM